MTTYISDTPDEEEEKQSRAKRVMSKLRARLISQDRLSRDSFASSIPPSDEDFGASFDKDELDDNCLVKEDNQHRVDEEEENNSVENEATSEDAFDKADSEENTDGGIDNEAFDKSNED